MASDLRKTDLQDPDDNEMPDLSGDEEDYNDYDFGDDYCKELQDLELNDLDDDSVALFKSVIFNGGASASQADKSNKPKTSDDNNARALVPAGGQKTQDDEDDIDSEEEKDIMREIRDEIENQVRAEMKDEINGYHERIKAIEAGHLPGRTDDEKNWADDDGVSEEMDSKLKEAIIKMNKLDKILRKRMKKEKEVKRDRLLLERRMRQEISEMSHGVTLYKEIKNNTEKFLALAPPPSHNEGISLNDDDEEEAPPLFQTQIDESEVKRRKPAGKADASGKKGQDAGDGDRPESTTSSQGKTSRATSNRSKLGGKGKGTNPKKDFIKRNKELAANADQPVAMTDDEKKRLAELLEGLDELPELEESAMDESLCESNPYQVSLHPGEGFCPDGIEMKSLTSIDARLKSIMPEEDFNSMFMPSAASHRAPSQQPLFTRVTMRAGTADLPERFGERVLYETKEERELKARLQSIEQELDMFKAPNGMEEDDSATEPHLTDEQLDKLLDQCARNMSTIPVPDTPDLSARSAVSSRQSLMENPPKLTDEQLQQLLSEAHFPLSSRLLALRNDDEKLLEEEGSTEAIRAETWKAIKDADPDAENIEDTLLALEDNTKKSEEEPVFSSSRKSSIPKTNVSSKIPSSSNDSGGPKLPGRGSHRGSTNMSVKSSARVAETAGTVASPGAFSSLNSNQNSSQPGQTTQPGVYDSSRELPRISQSSSVHRSDSYSALGNGTPLTSSRASIDSNSEQVRFPDLCASPFLIHAQQGMNNTDGRDSTSLPSRQPLQMVHNDLSDMRVDSFSEDDREGARFQGRVQRSSSGTAAAIQPKPPPSRNQPPKT